MPQDGITTESAGEYLNIFHDGELRVSLSESENEVLVYEDGIDQPRARFNLDDGSMMDI